VANFLGVRALPPMRSYRSPEVVRTFDELRKKLEDHGGYSEFCWFAREYPRCYRFHMDGADFRLRTIHALMTAIYGELSRAAASDSTGRLFGVSVSDARVLRIYWDFESYLSEISASLDLLARIVGPAFRQDSPPSFSKLAKRKDSHPLVLLFRKAERLWVGRLKDYRDCFVHYTPVDTQLSVSLTKFDSRRELRAKLPVNPNVRDILGFRYTQRVELLAYAISVHKRMSSFDKAIATAVWRLHREGFFPLRTERLFFLGQRYRQESEAAGMKSVNINGQPPELGSR